MRLTIHVIQPYSKPKKTTTRPMAFYNTIRLNSPELEKKEARAASQENFVKALFRSNPDRKISPSQVQTIAASKYGRHVLLTSWRRAFSDLTKAGILVKCGKDDQVVGPHGEKEHTWRYNEAADTKALESFFSDLQEGKLENREKCSEVSPRAYTGNRNAAPPAPRMFVQQELFAY